MVINGDGEDVTSGLVDDTEAVALATGDIDNSPIDLRTALEATDAIDGTRIRDWNDTSSNVAIKKRKGGVLPPITNFDDLLIAMTSS